MVQTPAEFASYFAYSLGWRAVRMMPRRMAYGTFSRLADQMWARRGAGVRQLERNYQRVLPDASRAEISDMTRAGMQSYFRYWCDVFRLPDWNHAQIIDTCVIDDDHTLRDVRRHGRGAVVALPHAGNWDHLGAYGTLEYVRVVSVAEDLKPERLTQKFLEFRESIGLIILTLRPDEDVFGQLIELVNAGHIIALLGDRDLTSSGVPVSFFGEQTRMPAGPAALAYETGAPLYTAAAWYEPRMTRGRISPEIPINRQVEKTAAIRQGTQAIADHIAQGISEHPHDWHMLQPLWLNDLDRHRLKTSKYDQDQ